MKEKTEKQTEEKQSATDVIKGKTGISVRGRSFVGTVLSDKMAKTVVVGWDRKIYIPKYERYQTKRSKVKAHNPEHINAKKGDKVVIMQCRPLSKTKHFIVTEKVE